NKSPRNGGAMDQYPSASMIVRTRSSSMRGRLFRAESHRLIVIIQFEEHFMTAFLEGAEIMFVVRIILLERVEANLLQNTILHVIAKGIDPEVIITLPPWKVRRN